MIFVPGVPEKGRVKHYERNGLYGLEEVLPFIGEETHDFDGDTIRMASVRLQLFRLSVVCVRCKLEGFYFAKERTIYYDRKSDRFWPLTTHFHFNLYGHGKHGNEVMLTKDHILPRSRGGLDELHNLQTMCAPCNSRKKDRMPNETDEEFAARRRREKEGIVDDD